MELQFEYASHRDNYYLLHFHDLLGSYLLVITFNGLARSELTDFVSESDFLSDEIGLYSNVQRWSHCFPILILNRLSSHLFPTSGRITLIIYRLCMGLRDHSEYYWKGSWTRKENRSVKCGQSVRQGKRHHKGVYLNRLLFVWCPFMVLVLHDTGQTWLLTLSKWGRPQWHIYRHLFVFRSSVTK